MVIFTFCLAKWSSWLEYDSCTKTCGGGTKTRSRTCENGVKDDDGYNGELTDIDTCHPQDCRKNFMITSLGVIYY